MPVVLRMRSPGWKIHSTPIRLAEIKYSDTSSAGKDVEIQEITHALLVGMYEWYNHSRKQFDGFLYNSTCNHHQTQQLHSWAFNQEKWKCMFLHNLGTNIQRSFIHNNPKLEITQISFDVWMIKPTMLLLKGCCCEAMCYTGIHDLWRRGFRPGTRDQVWPLELFVWLNFVKV